MAANPYGFPQEVQDLALSMGLGDIFGLSAPVATAAKPKRPGYKTITLPDMREMEIPENPSEEEKYKLSVELATAFPEEYGELLDPYQTLLGGTAEFFKGIPRGFASGLVQVAQGVAGAVTPGTDTEIEKDLAGIQSYLEKESPVSADPVYRDTMASKIGAGLGSFATFAVPGSAAKLLGANPASVATKSAIYGMAGATGVGTQAQRIMEQRELGKEISAGRELMALTPGLLIGLSEALPVERLFKKGMAFDPAKGSALRNILARVGKGNEVTGTFYDDITRLLGGALKQGAVEGLQEAISGAAQDTISKVVYDPDMEIGGSALDDLLVGGGVGVLADVIVDAMGGRRTVANEAYREREKRLRQEVINQYDMSQAVKIARANQQAAADKPAAIPPVTQTLALPPPTVDGVYNVSLRSDPDRSVMVPVFTQQGKTFAYNPEANNYVDLTDAVASGDDIADVITTAMGRDIGAIPASKEVDAGLSLSTLKKQVNVYKSSDFPYFNIESISNDIANNQLSPITSDSFATVVPLPQGFALVDLNTGRPIADFSGEVPTTALFTNANEAYAQMKKINVKKALINSNDVMDFTGIPQSRGALTLSMMLRTPEARMLPGGYATQYIDKPEKRVGLKKDYSPEELKKLLGPDQFNLMMADLAQANIDKAEVLDSLFKNVAEVGFSKRSISANKLTQLGKSKNLDIDINSKPFKQFAKYWTGTANWLDMSNGQRLYLMARIGQISPFSKRVDFPNLLPRQYKRDQFDRVLAAIGQPDGSGKTAAVSVDDIAKAANSNKETAKQIFDDLVFSGRAAPVAKGKIRLQKSEADFQAEREAAAARVETPLTLEPAEAAEIKQAEVLEKEAETAAIAAQAVEEGADPAIEATAAKFSNALTDALNKAGLANLVKVKAEVKKAKREAGKKAKDTTSGWFDPINKEIVVFMPEQLNNPNITEQEIVDYANQVLNHEIIHVMREADLITEAEWNTLRSFVKSARINREVVKNDVLLGKDESLLDNVRRRYANEKDMTEEDLIEEAIAEAYRLWNKHGGKWVAGKPQSVFRKILNYIKSFASAFKSSGATNVDQIFSSMASGEVAKRTPGLSVFNPDADAAIRTLRRSDVIDSPALRQVQGKRPKGVQKFAPKKAIAADEADANKERDEAFNKLADMQRGKPEMAMLVVQDTLKKEPYYSARGNGSLNYLVEHVGDLTHRMAEKYATMPGSDMGIEYVEPKLRSAVRILSNRIDLQLLGEFPEMPELARYAEEHKKLPVYNEAQRLARDAAVAIGERNFVVARDNLQKLKGMVDNGTYVEEASKFTPAEKTEVKISKANEERVDNVIRQQIENAPPGFIPRFNPNAPKAATLAAIQYETDGREPEMPAIGRRLAISAINQEDVPNSVIRSGIRKYGQINEDNRTWGQKTLDLINDILPDFGRTFRKEFVDKNNEFRRQETELIGTENERNLMAETSASARLGALDRLQGIVAAVLSKGGIRWITGSEMATRDADIVQDRLAGYHQIDTSVPGLIEIFKPLQDGTVPNGMRQYKAYATFKRIQGFRRRAEEARRRLETMGDQMSPDEKLKANTAIEMEKKVRLQDNPSDAEISSLIEAVETNYPTIKEVYDKYQKFNGMLIDFGVATNVLTEDLGNQWKEWADYFPFYKELEDSIAKGHGFKKKSSLFRSDFFFNELSRDAKDLEAADPFEMIVKNTSGIIFAGLRNMASLSILRNSVDVGEARLIDGPNPRKQAARIRKNGGYTQVVFDEGRELYYEISDPLLHESMMTFGEPAFNTITRILAAPAGVLREMVTREPGFIFQNVIRDGVSAWVTSPVGFIPIIDSFRNWNSDELEYLNDNGIIGGYDSFRDPKDLKDYVKRQLRLQGVDVRTHSQGVFNMHNKIWDALGSLSQKSDGAIRATVYKSILKETGSEAQARLAAIEVMNFSRRGSNPIFRSVTAAIPFLNARVQSYDKLYTTLTGKYSPYDGLTGEQYTRNAMMKRALQRLAMIAAMTSIYWTIMSNDDDYKKLRREVREDNWIIPTGVPGVFAKLAIPYEVGIISKAIPEIFLNYMAGDLDTRAARDSLVRQIGNTTNLSLTSFQIFKPIADIIKNKDSFTKGDIVPYWTEQNTARYMQYDDRTTEISKGLARAANYIGLPISPMWIDYVVGGYGGSMATSILLLADKTVKQAMGDKTAGTRADYTDINNIPVLRRFFLDMGTTGSRLQQEFYELRKEVDKAVGTMNKMKKEGLTDDYLLYRNAKNDLIGTRNAVNAIDKYLVRYRQYRKMIIESDMPDDQKREALQELEDDKNLRLSSVPALRDRADLPNDVLIGIFDAFTGG